MAEGARARSAAELEAALAALSGRVAFPPAGDLAPAVMRQIASMPAHDRPPAAVRALPLRRPRGSLRPIVRPAWHKLAAAAVALLVALTGTLLISPRARHAVADLLGLRGVRIKSVRTLPPPAPSPSELGTGLDLGERVSLQQAQAMVAYRILVPRLPELGAPDEVYVQEALPGGQVSLVYRARSGLPVASTTGAGLLVSQFNGRVDRPFLEKILASGGTLQAVRVNGEPGFWISGNLHEILYLDANGRLIPDSVRLAGDVLLWQRGGLTLRLEGGFTLAQALRIARSVR